MQSNSEESRNWAMFCHLAAFAWLLLTFIGLPVPFLIANIIGPLIVWLIKKNESEFINAHGKESINFQISLTLYSLGLVILIGGFIFLLVLGGVIGENEAGIAAILIGGVGILFLILLSILVGIAQIAFVIFAAIKANRGEMYRYPLTIRFL